MRIALSTLPILLATTHATDTLLRGATSVDPTAHTALTLALSSADDSSCLQSKDRSSCIGQTDEVTGEKCTWCKCSAVPSECLPTSVAAGLPEGVFDCGPKGVVESDAEEEEEERVYTLRGAEVDRNLCDPDSKSISGYMDISGSKYDAKGENKHYFFWFFEKRAKKDDLIVDAPTPTDASKIPLILWLTGGPGCSSTLALLAENGPCSVHPDGQSTMVNPHSWTEAGHVLWLDQPAGVGYSYGKGTDTNEEMVGEDAYYFLQEFYKEYPEYKENPLFVTGESYGGHYVPSIAHRLQMGNKEVEDGSVGAEKGLAKINLKGVAIGNGLTNPEEQYKWYPEMAYNNSHGIKTVPKPVYDAMKAAVPKCIDLIKVCNKGTNFVDKVACQGAFFYCNSAMMTPYRLTMKNPYDIRLKCSPTNPLCYDFSMVEKWLNLDATKKALHVKEDAHWQSCNMGINLKFHNDWIHDFSHHIADLLDAKIPALIYAGDVDFVCNYMGNRAWTQKLDWTSGEKFRAAEDHPWGDKTKPAGLARSVDGFTFLQVYDAGHMVPADKPEVALKMITDFVNGVEF